MRRRAAVRRAFSSAAVALVAGVTLAACAQQEPAPTPTETAPSTLEVPVPDVYDPNAPDEANRALFDRVIQGKIDENVGVSARELVNALADAGFDKTRMEATFDATSIDIPVDYIIVSVKLGDDQCLIGQRAADKSYSSQLIEPLNTGTCLVGKTQDIDW